MPIVAGSIPFVIPELSQSRDNLSFASQHIFSIDLIIKVHAK